MSLLNGPWTEHFEGFNSRRGTPPPQLGYLKPEDGEIPSSVKQIGTGVKTGIWTPKLAVSGCHLNQPNQRTVEKRQVKGSYNV